MVALFIPHTSPGNEPKPSSLLSIRLNVAEVRSSHSSTVAWNMDWCLDSKDGTKRLFVYTTVKYIVQTICGPDLVKTNVIAGLAAEPTNGLTYIPEQAVPV